MSSTCFLNPPIIRGEIWGLQRLSSMFKVTQMVWGRGRIWTRGSQTPYPRISGHFALTLGCASEAAKSLWFMEHIVLGVPSVSPSCFASPPPYPFSPTSLHSVMQPNPWNQEFLKYSPFHADWNDLFACLISWWDRSCWRSRQVLFPFEDSVHSPVPGT